uniref:Regulator of chromosome condensation n=1 Tax=Theileria parva TaxID=5875 RepID=Q4N6H9_THEPA|eukprot:XP_766712.1 hypothetical protein [Theileria parva strain Muguga]
MKFVRYFIKNLRVSFFYPIFQIPNAVSFCDSNSVSFCDSNTAKPRDSKPQTHKSHNVYMFGSVKSLPEGLSKHPLLQRLECKLVDFGPNFGVAVDKKSNVYLWGSDTQNEFVKPFLLCTLSNIKDLQVRFRENVRIKDVVCGQTHTLCIDTNNNIYSFGDDSEIELFFGDSRGKSIFEHRHYKPYLKRIYNFSPINTSPIIYNQTEKHLQYVPVRINEMSLLKRYGELIRKSDIKLQAGNHFTIIAITPTHSLHTVNNSEWCEQFDNIVEWLECVWSVWKFGPCVNSG